MGQLIGLVDYGELTPPNNQANADGDHALVLMFQPNLGGWSQTIGSFCAKSATPGKLLALLIMKAIICLEQCGAIVTSTVCDGSSSNKSALTELGISGVRKRLKNTFKNPVSDQDIFVLIDMPHALKCVRNMLMKAKIFKVIQGAWISGGLFPSYFKNQLTILQLK